MASSAAESFGLTAIESRSLGTQAQPQQKHADEPPSESTTSAVAAETAPTPTAQDAAVRSNLHLRRTLFFWFLFKGSSFCSVSFLASLIMYVRSFGKKEHLLGAGFGRAGEAAPAREQKFSGTGMRSSASHWREAWNQPGSCEGDSRGFRNCSTAAARDSGSWPAAGRADHAGQFQPAPRVPLPHPRQNSRRAAAGGAEEGPGGGVPPFLKQPLIWR